MSEEFGPALRRRRVAACLSQPQLARRVHVHQSAISRWETGHTVPDRDIAEQLDTLLEAGGQLARLVIPATPIAPIPTDEPVTTDYIDDLRTAITDLVRLDGLHGGTELAPMAARMFRSASARLGGGKYAPELERDFAATVAELGEVAGWLAFDATQYDRARTLNLEALHLARLAGDSNMELFLLGNMALQAQETGQAREALRTVQLMERFPLTPRLRIMVAQRRARAAADLGDDRSFALIHRAKVEVNDSVHATDPEWTWWIDYRELLAHEGGMWRAAGRPERAVECYSAALATVPRGYRWASYIGGASLVSALVDVRSWAEAERAAGDVARLAHQVSSVRAIRRLRDTAATARKNRAPSSLESILNGLASH